MLFVVKLHFHNTKMAEGEPAVYTFIHYTLLLVEKAGVAPDVQECRRENHPGFPWRNGDGHTKYKIGAISGPTKWTLVPIFLKVYQF